jgi:hypothetical protein
MSFDLRSKDRLRKIMSAENSPLTILLALLAVTFLTYGLLFNQLGFYWDDLGISWIRYNFDARALQLYFASSRPLWGLLYQFTGNFIPDNPVYWQIVAVILRWVTAALCWAVFRELWPQRRRLALTVSLFFLLYPGFNLQWVSYVYSHFYIVLSFFLLSYLLMLLTFRHPKYFWPLTIAALFASAFNLWMMEYFFFLELMRPFIIIVYLRENFSAEEKNNLKKLLPQTFVKWLPYLVVWLADVFYRMFVFSNTDYKSVLVADLQTKPFAALLQLIQTVFSDLWLVSANAWALAFHFPSPSIDGPLTTLFYAAVVIIVGILTAILFLRARDDEKQNYSFALWTIALGFFTMLVAGIPYWLAKFEVTLGFPADRFTISFMLGVAIFLAGLLELIPSRVRIVFAVALVALAAGRQALFADAFRRDWVSQKTLFWQMTWRAPGIAPNTLVLMNEGPFNYYADNSLGAALNWIYDPDNHSAPIHYALFYPTSRMQPGGSLPGLQAGLPINYDYAVGKFSGSTSQVLSFYFQPPGCLRLLDPEIDSKNHFIADESMMRDAAQLSSSAWIKPDLTARIPKVYGPEPAHGWCYYFEQADLARQMGDWSKVVQLGDQAFKLNDHPNDPVERFVFIEGYAHVGNWQRVKELAIASYKVSPTYVGPLLCKLLNRIDHDVASDNEKQTSLNELRTKFSCLP